jgi:RraA family protein
MIGLRVNTQWVRCTLPEEKDIAGVSASHVSDSMHRRSGGDSRLRPFHRSGVLMGPALTVKTRAGDNLMIHKAVQMAAPGDVIVIDGSGDTSRALIGDLLVTAAQARGVAGFVIDGAVRDSDTLLEMNFPVFAVAANHVGPYKQGPGEIGFPIAVAGMVVQPGDLVYADHDGVVCVPRADMEAVIAAARRKRDAEAVQREGERAGTIDKSWIDRQLADLGCTFV